MKKNTFLLVFCLCTFSSINGLEKSPYAPLVIRSGSAEYNGDEIHLNGDVDVQHALGSITAKCLSLSSVRQESKKVSLSLLEISQDVKITLQGGAHLDCQKAEVNSVAMEGLFFGSFEYPEVIYSHMTLDNKLSFILKSYSMHLNLDRQSVERDSKRLFVKQVIADGKVKAYHQNLILLADKADYKRLTLDEDSPKGTLSLTANPDAYCEVIKANGDHIQAKSIVYNLFSRQMHLTNTKGSLESDSPVKSEFSADKMVWDDKEHSLLLNGDVHFTQEGKLAITTNHEVILTHYLKDKKRKIKSIESPKETEIIYYDDKKKLSHKMICHGPVVVDFEHLKTTLGTPKTAQETLVTDQQIYFEDAFGDMYADQIVFNYVKSGGKINLANVILEGHVKILNRFDGHLQETSSVLHYALADHVEYFPVKNEIMLSSYPSQRVLFFDKVNKVQMSAPKLKILRGQENQKPSVQGIGDVRFTFIEGESL